LKITRGIGFACDTTIAKLLETFAAEEFDEIW
jgi:hypothetical protein